MDIKFIVDNDYVNHFSVYESLEEIMKDFNENEDDVRDRIVAECDGYYLVRYY